ncbi:MAG: hypothetical protein AABZ53_15180 [Planctomycetota bacterium]
MTTHRFNPLSGRVKPRGLAPLWSLALLALAGCVTETGSGRSRPPIARPAPVELPTGPIAQPAGGSTSSTNVEVLIRPRGTIPYDGLTLPLLSPDGRLVATTRGPAPTWPTVLAQLGSETAPITRVVVFDISEKSIVEVRSLEGGVLLGRSSDAQGFVVEWPRADGSQWIGTCGWLDAKPVWLVQDSAVSAHATLGPGGLLAFTQRARGDQRAVLVVRSPSGGTTVLPDSQGSFLFPTFGNDPAILYVFLSSQAGLELLALPITPGQIPRIGTPLARRRIDANGDPALAYQAIAAVQTPPATNDTEAGMAYFEPRSRRVIEMTRRLGLVSVLPEDTFAAVRAPALSPGGWFVSGVKGVSFSPDPTPALGTDGNPKPRPPDARLFDVPHVPRASRDPQRPIVLFGPVKDSGLPLLTVIELLPRPPEAAK